MNEQLRQAYLRTMGIDVFYPRAPVPGARPSPDYDLSMPAFLLRGAAVAGEVDKAGRKTVQQSGEKPGDQVVKSGTGPGIGEAPQQASRTRSAREALGLQDKASRKQPAAAAESLAGARQATATEQLTDSANVEAGTETTPRFRLQYRRINKQLAVLQEVPVHAQQQLTSQTTQLLNNILRALDVEPEEENQANPTGSELFNWPLSSELPAEEATPRRASQALLGFIAMRRQRDDFRNLLVFTSQTGQIVELLPEAETATGGDYRIDKLDCWLTRVSSLQEMLSLPSIKREVWQDLQPLRARLKTV